MVFVRNLQLNKYFGPTSFRRRVTLILFWRWGITNLLRACCICICIAKLSCDVFIATRGIAQVCLCKSKQQLIGRERVTALCSGESRIFPMTRYSLQFWMEFAPSNSPGKHHLGERQSIAQKGVHAIDARNSQLENRSNATKTSVRAPRLSTDEREHPLVCYLGAGKQHVLTRGNDIRVSPGMTVW